MEQVPFRAQPSVEVEESAEIPVWGKLGQSLRDDLAEKLGQDAERIWNGWDNDQRQRLLNARAVLIDTEVWSSVTGITFGDLKKRRRVFSKNTASFTPNQKGWFLTITASQDLGPGLKKAGWKNRWNPNHPENQRNWMQPGKGIVMHLGQLIPPDDQYYWIHFDRGGGRLTTWDHFKELMTGTGAATDEITEALGETEAARHLRGISERMDQLLGTSARGLCQKPDRERGRVDLTAPSLTVGLLTHSFSVAPHPDNTICLR
jgi:hypothetical protein